MMLVIASRSESVSALEGERFANAAVSAALHAGWGEGFGFAGSGGTENEDVGLVVVTPSLGVGVGGPLGGDAWWRGAFELRLDGQLWINTDPRNGEGGGATLSLRYSWLHSERFVPFLELGAGLGGIDFDLSSQRDGFNFILQGGGGFHWMLGERFGLTPIYRYHHMSNANTRKPNQGINSHQFLIGPTVWFR